jgi:8-oxo-dGTP pyrophosphatase MutT (NUDIX family)|tara:strand:- start:1560 stop:2162 length:603 start_codon:yes stop_codon:yes gene_type:complete
MTKNEFLHRFQLQSLSESTHSYQYNRQLKNAAVLIPIVEVELEGKNKQLDILFTKRADHLTHHAGQVSFPGGKVEPFDGGLINTALREAQEEIGLNINEIEIVGQLHPYQTISGYIVTPIIAFISAKQNYIMDDNEVAEIFQVPLHHFLNTDNHHSINIVQKNSHHQVHFMPYQQYNIWGATAAMLKDLMIHLSYSKQTN